MYPPATLPMAQLEANEDKKIYAQLLKLFLILQVIFCVIDLFFYGFIREISNALWPIIPLLSCILGYFCIRKNTITLNLLSPFFKINCLCLFLFITFLVSSLILGNYRAAAVNSTELLILLVSTHLVWLLIASSYKELGGLTDPLLGNIPRAPPPEAAAAPPPSSRTSVLPFFNRPGQQRAIVVGQNAASPSAPPLSNTPTRGGFQLFQGQGNVLGGG